MERIKRIFQGSVLAGMLFLFLGLFFFYLMGQIKHLTCARAETGEVLCGMRVTWMDLFPVKNVNIDSLKGAEVEQDCDDDGCTYRVTLQTTAGDVPFTSYESDYSKINGIADQINRFLQNPSQPSLRLKSGGGPALIAPVIFLGIGIFLFIRSLKRLFRGQTVD
ncbi:MAG: hypothetical protein JW987_15005 [Anaerolineaceae bacterium]|nr:hypothetical protein [Anaerolineaceae bacterium]